MVIDTSAVIAILQQEPEAERLARAIAMADRRLLSAASLLEAGMLMRSRFGPHGERDLDKLLVSLKIEIAPVTAQQIAFARAAFSRFGKGLHPAALNFGDCFSYGLAKDIGDALLFKGDDFSRTDLPVAPY